MRHRSRDLYLNRVSFDGRLSIDESKQVDALFLNAKKEYAAQKQIGNPALHPAVQTLLWVQRKERAVHLRGITKKPIGIGSNDFRRKASNIINAETYFAQVPVSRHGVDVAGDAYVAQLNTILFIDTSDAGADAWGYLKCESVVHASCIRADLPIQGRWVLYDEESKHFSIDPGHLNAVSMHWQSVVRINGTFLAFESTEHRVAFLDDESTVWRLRLQQDFERCVEQLDAQLNSEDEDVVGGRSGGEAVDEHAHVVESADDEDDEGESADDEDVLFGDANATRHVGE